MFEKSEDELLNDNELRNLIEQVRPVPDRDPVDVKHGRERYLSQLNELVKPHPRQFIRARKINPLSTERLREKPIQSNHQKRWVFSVIALVAVLALIFFGGAGVTAYAAQAALPGDALYPIKTSLEQTQVRLARDAGDQAQLHLAFAERRLQEISSLIDEGRFGEIDQAASEFESHVQQAINALHVVAAGDPARASVLAGQIARALTEYGNRLSDMMASVPDNLRTSMQRAIQASQSGNQMPLNEDGNLIGNFNYNTNLNDNENGNVNLNENESNDNDDNLNNIEQNNQNDNEEHDNTNLNSNDNSNTNMNENQNDNSEDHNGNTNYNSNHNGNDNEQENHNTNTNRNDNSNDNEGSNHNDNGDHNENGGD